MTSSPPWAWLRGFAWFLIAWPLMTLIAADTFRGQEWGAILGVVFVPPVIGAVLLGVEYVLRRTLGKAALFRGHAHPSWLRDLSNVALCLAILLVIDLVLVTVFESEHVFSRHPDAAPRAARLLGSFLGGALLLRGVDRLRYGRRREGTLGPAWERDRLPLQFVGYLTLVPTLLVCTVMVDYAISAKPFGSGAWIALPALLWLGLRSAMADSPCAWARTPWEAELRGVSLALPWWAVSWLLGVAISSVFVLMPTGLGEPMAWWARVLVGLLFAPIGLCGVGGALWLVLKTGPNLVRRARALTALARDPESLESWERHGPSGNRLRLVLRGGRSYDYEVPAQTRESLFAWLEVNRPARP